MYNIVHFELPASETARAKKFYEKAFGWKVNKFPMDGMEYFGLITGDVDSKNMPKTKGFINGGMFKRNEHVSGPVVAVSVPNLKQVLTKVTKLGGAQMGETMKVADMGLYAYIKDTEGNLIGIWQDLKKSVQKPVGKSVQKKNK